MRAYFTIITAILLVLTSACQADPEPNDAPSPAPSENSQATDNAASPTPDMPEQRADMRANIEADMSTGEAKEDMVAAPTGCDAAPAVVELQTSDGVKLVADYIPAKSSDRGVVILLHMIPPNFDRSSYPDRVKEAINALDLNVLNVDRRGAGDSEGDAVDAYTGLTARLDVEAAVSFMLAREGACAIDPGKITLIGASNGTTAVLDYTVNRSDADLPDPNALVWLSPGSYTENQNKLSENKAKLDPIPLLIIHPDSEPWATQLTDVAQTCKIVEIDGGAHGTANFDDGAKEAIQLPEIISWLETHTK